MKRFLVTGFLALLSFDTLAQISFKYTAMDAEPLEFSPAWLLRVLGNPWISGALCGYLGAVVTWMSLLRRAPVGPSFAASHLELVSVTFFSVWLFNEPLNAPKIAGGLLILLGVLCLAKGESAENAEKPPEAAGPGASGEGRFSDAP
jgi:drug/metabolite transporter (DMT)-like permease